MTHASLVLVRVQSLAGSGDAPLAVLDRLVRVLNREREEALQQQPQQQPAPHAHHHHHHEHHDGHAHHHHHGGGDGRSLLAPLPLRRARSAPSANDVPVDEHALAAAMDALRLLAPARAEEKEEQVRVARVLWTDANACVLRVHVC